MRTLSCWPAAMEPPVVDTCLLHRKAAASATEGDLEMQDDCPVSALSHYRVAYIYAIQAALIDGSFDDALFYAELGGMCSLRN